VRHAVQNDGQVFARRCEKPRRTKASAWRLCRGFQQRTQRYKHNWFDGRTVSQDGAEYSSPPTPFTIFVRRVAPLSTKNNFTYTRPRYGESFSASLEIAAASLASDRDVAQDTPCWDNGTSGGA